MAKKQDVMAGSSEPFEAEPSIIQTKVLDVVEDVFHVALTALLFLVALGAVIFTVVRLLNTVPFYPNGMLQAINDILFVVIILEIARTVIARFNTGFYQLSRFLVIGVIASVRHILSVGSSLTLSIGKTPEAFERGIIELLVNGGIVVALVLAIFMTRVAERQPGVRNNSSKKPRKAD
ncbi:MAG: phosphate-starvation-inducible PsiE family protein [Rhodoluna sp.]